MPPVFIFAEQIHQLVKSGRKEVQIPEGARISSAAADLIKEHNLEIKTVVRERLPEDPPPPNDAESVDPPLEVEDSKATPTPPDGIQAASPPADFSEVTEAELEEIVSRVIKRFEELKGAETTQNISQKSAEPAQAEAKPGDDDLVICRCEEITRAEIKTAIRNGMHTLNGIKRVTRAGMGLCQGQTCQQLVTRILAQELGVGVDRVDPTTARGPVRPLRLAVYANS